MFTLLQWLYCVGVKNYICHSKEVKITVPIWYREDVWNVTFSSRKHQETIPTVRLLQFRLKSLKVCHSRMFLAGIYDCVAVDSR